jgi:cytochrome c peroxidase
MRHCHFIPLFNGLVPPEFTETETEVLGIPATKSKMNAALDSDPENIISVMPQFTNFSLKLPHCAT